MTAVDIFAMAINKQIIPIQIIMGINVPLISVIFLYLFASMPATADISASLAKSEGWKAWFIIGTVSHLLASLMVDPKAHLPKVQIDLVWKSICREYCEPPTLQPNWQGSRHCA